MAWGLDRWPSVSRTVIMWPISLVGGIDTTTYWLAVKVLVRIGTTDVLLFAI